MTKNEKYNIYNIIQMKNLMILKNFLPNELIYEVAKYIQPSHEQLMNELIKKVKMKNTYKSFDVVSLYPFETINRN